MRRAKWVFIAFLLVSLINLTGCIRRRLMVRTDPGGAAVYLDGEHVGFTKEGVSLEIPFDFYGTREVVVRRKGYLTAEKLVTIEAPWYEIFPLDFFSEVLWPFSINDNHPVDFILKVRKKAIDTSKLRKRAEKTRKLGKPLDSK